MNDEYRASKNNLHGVYFFLYYSEFFVTILKQIFNLQCLDGLFERYVSVVITTQKEVRT